MSYAPRVTQQMLVAAYLNCDPTDRTYAMVSAELERRFGVTLGRTVFKQRLKEWNIADEVAKLGRHEAQQAVANALVGEDRAKLNSQIGSLNHAEAITGKLLQMAEELLEKTTLAEDLDTAAQALTIAQDLMKTSSMIRKDMADIQEGLPAEKKPDDLTNVVAMTPDVARYQAQ